MSDGVTAMIAAVVALAIGAALQPAVLRLLTAAAVWDVPTERSSHRAPVPRGGGIAVVVALVLGLALVPGAWVVAAPVLLFALIGLADDLRGLTVLVRLAAQLVVAAVAAVLLVPPRMPAVVVTVVGAGVGTVLAAVVAAVWLTAVVNAVNFMDGVNGISAMYAAVAGAAFAVAGVRFDVPLLTGAGAVLAAAAVSFLPWNAWRARIFLGDVGSYGLGAAIGAAAVCAVAHGVPIEVAVAPVAVYLADTGWTLVRRIRRGEAWYRPHRTHVFQQLTDAGWSHLRVALAVTALSALLCLAALAGAGAAPLARVMVDVGCLALLGGYLALPRLLALRRRANVPGGAQTSGVQTIG